MCIAEYAVTWLCIRYHTDAALPVQVRTIVQQEMQKALSDCDALISPAAPTTAYKLGHVKNDPLEMYKGDIMTINVNLAGKETSGLGAYMLHSHTYQHTVTGAHTTAV